VQSRVAAGEGGDCTKTALQRGEVPGVALPDYPHAPSEFCERAVDLAVAGNVPVEFCLPEVDPSLGGVGEGATGMPVPEAAVDEDRDLPAGQDDVGDARKVAPVEPEPKTKPVQDASDGDLGVRIPSPDPRHHGASFWRDWLILPGLSLLAVDGESG
jgi:hypothetical protein